MEARDFKDGLINDVVITRLDKMSDSRGWLSELYREDMLPSVYHPVMCYASTTLPGVTRGPHEHVSQTDFFCFIGSEFKIFLWDNRDWSATYNNRMIEFVGGDQPSTVIVPPGVVHAYYHWRQYPSKSGDGLVLNFPNQLYAGENKAEKVDEIRHEKDPSSPFRISEADLLRH